MLGRVLTLELMCCQKALGLDLSSELIAFCNSFLGYDLDF